MSTVEGHEAHEELRRQHAALTTHLATVTAERERAITWAVEWALKHAMNRDQCPQAWDAGFPSYKAQALLDYAALVAPGGDV